MGLDHRLDERQAEPEAALGATAVPAKEAIPNAVTFLGWDSDSGVCD
jgi:hypothetical protein